MAKLSVSVSDDLWNRARRLRPHSGRSELVQEALTEFVQSRAPDLNITIPRPSEAAELLQAAQEGLRADLETSYANGYRMALAQVCDDVVGWLDLQRFEDTGWRIDDWLDDLYARESRAATTVGGALEFSRLVGGGTDPAFVKGYREAMRDLWNSLQDSPGEGTVVGSDVEAERAADRSSGERIAAGDVGVDEGPQDA